jgi:phage terminase large subunit-like protein
VIASFQWLLSARQKVQAKLIAAMSGGERSTIAYVWEYWTREEQLPPSGDWRIWMVMAGRGFGKTRASAAWVRMTAERQPGARIALVSASLAEARAVMVKGESGLLAIYPPHERPVFEPSLQRVRFANGSQAQLLLGGRARDPARSAA